jgi:hypothetical protein
MKYTTLQSFKQYARVVGTTDDADLIDAVARAEEAIDCHCGTHFEWSTNAGERVRRVWVNEQGYITMQLRRPAVHLTALTILDTKGQATWQPLTLKAIGPLGELALIDPEVANGDPPIADSYIVRCYSSSPILAPAATGRYWALANYTSGYLVDNTHSFPVAVRNVTNRLGYFYYKLREAPMVKAIAGTLGTIELPLDCPPDVRATLNGWRRLPT